MRLPQWCLSVLVLALAGTMLSSCGGAQAKQDEQTTIEASKDFLVLDESLGERLTITKSMLDNVAGSDIPTAMVELQSVYYQALDIQYRFAWYDASGFELELESEGWKPVRILAKGLQTLKATAPNAAAKSFKIFIK